MLHSHRFISLHAQVLLALSKWSQFAPLGKPLTSNAFRTRVTAAQRRQRKKFSHPLRWYLWTHSENISQPAAWVPLKADICLSAARYDYRGWHVRELSAVAKPWRSFTGRPPRSPPPFRDDDVTSGQTVDSVFSALAVHPQRCRSRSAAAFSRCLRPGGGHRVIPLSTAGIVVPAPNAAVSRHN